MKNKIRRKERKLEGAWQSNLGSVAVFESECF